MNGSPAYTFGVAYAKLFCVTREQLASLLVSFTILSTFSPIKIYPVFFVLTSLVVLCLHSKIRPMVWPVWLYVYVGYAVLVAALFNTGVLPHRLPMDREQLTNLVKLVIGSAFLVVVVNWASFTRGATIRRYLDWMLHVSFLLTLAQLLFFRYRAGFSGLFVESSMVGSEFYDPKNLFWGIADKNIIGARIALFGFLYLFNYFIWKRKLPLWRTLIVFLCALLSASRTPMVALFIGIVYVLYRKFKFGGRIVLALSILASLPFALARVLRFDSLLDPHDGMGVRIIYWSTFIERFPHLSIFGSGFMSADRFLTDYSPIYYGEPHLHNLFLNNYLDFGIIGSVAYIAFLVTFFRFCKREKVWFGWYWTAAFLPILAIMLTLSTGYESDTSVYLSCIYIIGHGASVAD